MKKLTIEIDDELHAKFKALMVLEGRSMKDELVDHIQKLVEEWENKK